MDICRERLSSSRWNQPKRSDGILMESWDAVVRQKFLRKSISGLAAMHTVYVSESGHVHISLKGLTWVIKKNKIWLPISVFPTCRHKTFTDLLRKREIEFLRFCQNKTNWLPTQWYWLALRRGKVWADSWHRKISATLFPCYHL